MTYKDLRELMKNKPDDEEVIILLIGDYTEEFSIEDFLIEGKLVLQ